MSMECGSLFKARCWAIAEAVDLIQKLAGASQDVSEQWMLIIYIGYISKYVSCDKTRMKYEQTT